MAEISPFQGIHFNQEISKDISEVICPPYDVISSEEQKRFYEKNEYNAIRLEHALILPGDDENHNKYSRSRDDFTTWLKEGILEADKIHSFYVYEQGFTFGGSKKKRLGLMACVMLESWEKKLILPHESTGHVVKTDRLNLMRSCNANISPILALYDDAGQKVTKLMMEKLRPSKLVIDYSDDVETHRVWRANEPEFVQRVMYFINPKPIYIADGHHRYETALNYREERKRKALSYTGHEAFNFIMMTLVSLYDPGLIVLPIHRLVRGLSHKVLSGLEKKLSDFFEVQSLTLDAVTLGEEKGSDIRVLGLEPGNIVGLRLRHSLSIDDIMPKGRSNVYKNLNVSILEHVIIEKILGLQGDNDNIAYTPNSLYTEKLIIEGQYQLAFLLSPVSVATIKAIADADDRMPRKSTYFYPKLPTGLIINRLDGNL